MKKYFLFLTIITSYHIAFSQSTEDSVKTTVNNMFTAMRTGDSSLLNRMFAKAAILQSIAPNKDGSFRIVTEPLKGFADLVATLKKDSADERIEFDAIHIDGPLASVWTPYKFYLNGKFSHCGVNSFQLVRVNGEWKISYIIDTRRRTACPL